MTRKTSPTSLKREVPQPQPDPTNRKPRRREPEENVVVEPINPPAVGGIKRGGPEDK